MVASTAALSTDSKLSIIIKLPIIAKDAPGFWIISLKKSFILG
jgi:hypothetical protein